MEGTSEEHISELFSTAVDTALGYSNIMLESTERLLKLNIEAARNRFDSVSETQKVLNINEAMAAAYEIMEQARSDITQLLVQHFEKTHRSAADLIRQTISDGTPATKLSNDLIDSISRIACAAQQQVKETESLSEALAAPVKAPKLPVPGGKKKASAEQPGAN